MGESRPSKKSPTRSSAARSRAGSAAPRRSGGPAARSRRPPGLALGALEALDGFDRGEFPATLYLDGPSEAVKTALLSDLKHAWRSHCPEAPLARVFRAGENGVEEILAAFQGTSLFSPRELILVLEVESLGRSEKRVSALAQGIARPLGGSSLVLVESAGDTIRKSLDPLRAACQARLEARAPGRPELIGWGTRWLGRVGIEAERGVVETVADACEGDALAFFSELGKLCTWAAGSKRLGLDDTRALLRPVVGADIPDYLSAVALGSATLATQRLGRLLAAGVGEGTILFSLSNLVGGALGGWARHREASEALRRRLSPAALGRALDAVYRAEAAWKGGRAEVVAVLEQATRAVAG